MSKILVPTDFSKQATYALDFAFQIAQKQNSEIELLHVLDMPDRTELADVQVTGQMRGPGMSEADIYYVKLMEKTHNDLVYIENDPKYEGVKIWHKLMQGSPHKAICREAKKSANLIIMGTAGTHSWEDELIGSNAEKVIRRAPCPVLTISESKNLKDIKNIVFASYFEKIDPEIIDLIKSVAGFMGAEIHLVKINTPSNFKNDKVNKAIIKSFAEENNFKNYKIHIFNHKNEEDGIVMFVEENKMDMIIMATEGRTGFARVLEGSIAEDVVNYSKIPVMTIKTN